jgi:hypothetical protein
VIPPALSDAVDPEERYLEWLQILQTSRAAEENRLGLVFRVDTIAPAGVDELQSINLAIRSGQILASAPAVVPEAIQDDELRILLSFRISTPLAYFVEGFESTIRRKTRKDEALARSATPVCLATLLEPASDLDASIDRPELFRRLKKSAKWNHQKAEDGTPPEISKVIYNLAIVLALTETGERITDLKDANLVKNFRWLLTRPWLDARLRPVFERGLAQLGAGQSA